MIEKYTTTRYVLTWILLLVILVLLAILFIFKPNEIDTKTITTPIDEKQIQLDIVTNVIDEVPESLNKTKRLVIKEYLFGCSQLQSNIKQMDCFELYYINNNDEIKEKFNECKSLTEKDNCKDEYYLMMVEEEGSLFCQGIQNEDLKQNCLETSE